MGVIYKLLPQIKDFIVEKKKENPDLSCRKTSSLVFNKFHLKLSKSSVNALIKQAGLSSPIGRRRKARRGATIEAEGLGGLLLKAIDYSIGGSLSLNEVIKDALPKRDDPCLLESLIYQPLFKSSADSQEIYSSAGLWPLVGKKYNPQDTLSYLQELQGIRTLANNIFKHITNLFKEVWFIKITFLDNSLLYMDAELRTVWSTPNIPFDFSSTIYKSLGNINKYLNKDSPFVFFTAPGYDIPTSEFFDFLMGQEAIQKKMVKITLYGYKMEELETIRCPGHEKRYFLFALWPWQFERYRKIKTNSEFRFFYFEPLQQEFYIAEGEIELSQPKSNQVVRLRGCILKSALNGKIKAIIPTNLPADKASLEEIVRLYLNRWPNLEEGFTDFSRKIELFTYTASSRKVFSTEKLISEGLGPLDIRAVLDYYLKSLDLYLRWHILPAEYEELDFSTTNQRFYQLKAKIKRKKDFQLVSFKLPKDYSFQKDLAYACQRLNEKEVISTDKKRLWFNID